MAEKTNYGGRKCLYKRIIHENTAVRVYLYRGWDLRHGKGWFSHTYFDSYNIGFGFHKTNKFTAVRQSLQI